MNAGRPHKRAEMELATRRHQAFLSWIGELRRVPKAVAR